MRRKHHPSGDVSRLAKHYESLGEDRLLYRDASSLQAAVQRRFSGGSAAVGIQVVCRGRQAGGRWPPVAFDARDAKLARARDAQAFHVDVADGAE